MSQMFSATLHREFRALLQIKETERLWHIPVLAALSVGIPLMVGLYLQDLKSGLPASLVGIVILYMPMAGLSHRMKTMFFCSLGVVGSFMGGLDSGAISLAFRSSRLAFIKQEVNRRQLAAKEARR